MSQNSNQSTMSISSSLPAEIIAGNTDLLTEILRRLPAKSLLRFKSVSKEWRFLISSFIFAGVHHYSLPQFSGVLLHRSSKSTLEFAVYDGGSHYRPNPTVLPQSVGNNSVRVLQSSNGLLLCSVKSGPHSRIFHVYNPTTGSSASIPSDGLSSSTWMNLVFDPSESQHYQLIGIYNNQIKRFSSGTGKWESFLVQTDFKRPFNLILSSGTYWRGCLHWMGPTGDSFFLHVENGTFGSLPATSILRRKMRRSILESSGGKLLLMEVYEEGEIRILEMKEDYTEWEIKYEIDAIREVCEVYPQVIGKIVVDESKIYHKLQACYVVSYGEDEITVVIRIPGKVLGYGLKSKKIWEMRDLLPSSEYASDFEWIDVFPYVETLAFV